jgi:hypothetical protein
MNPSDQLLTFAEISVALAGFAGIIATFQFREQRRLTRGRVLDLSMIVNISLLSAFFSVFPLALLVFGFEEKTVWAICSGIAGAIWISVLIFVVQNMSTQSVSSRLQLFFAFIILYSLATAVILFMNALGIIFDQHFAPYFSSFILAFFLVCFNFSRLLMHPLWKALRKQEISSSDPENATALRR